MCLLRYYIALSPMLYYFVLTNFWVGEGGIGARAWILQAQPLYRIYSLNQINASKEIERNRPLSMNNIKEPAVYSVVPTGHWDKSCQKYFAKVSTSYKLKIHCQFLQLPFSKCENISKEMLFKSWLLYCNFGISLSLIKND